ncbi:MAG: tetratricopeptide repeat protein [Thermoplasmatota archaeon]
MKNLDTKDLILIYLEGYTNLKDKREVPYGLTARGIIEGIGTSENESYQALEEMEKEGLIEERVKSVSGVKRDRNVYFLSEKGLEIERNIWNKIKNEAIKIKTEDDIKTIKLKKVKNYIEGRNPIIESLKIMKKGNVIDLKELDKASDIFVGRKDELDFLIKNLHDVKENGADLVLIEGEAGIGKTSLVLKLKPFAQELDFEFLTGTCQSEVSDPYLPLKEAFSKYIEGDTSESISDMAFIGMGEGEKSTDKNLFDANKKKTFYDTTKFVKDLTDKKPFVVFLDDLQWVDKATVDILSYMNNKLDDSPILFIGTYRPEDVSNKHHLMDMKHRLNRKGKIKTLEIKPLNLENTEDTIKGILGEENIPQNFVKIIHEKTDGNPLFLKETINQMLRDDIIDLETNRFPESSKEIKTSELVNNVIERRIKRFDDETKKLIEIGSVIGGSISFELLCEISNLDEIDLLDHIDILMGDQLWEEDKNDENFHFSHDLIEKTVYERIRDMKKKVLHKKIADNISKIYESQIDRWFSDLAYHYEKGGEYSKALEYYIKAGEQAENVYANEDAIEMYEKALELADKNNKDEIDLFKIYENITRAYTLLGLYKKSRTYLNEALDIPGIDNKKKAVIYRKIANTWTNQSEYEKALENIEEGMKHVEENPAVKSELLGNKGWIYIRRSKYNKSKKIFKEELNAAKKSGKEKSISQAYHNLGTAHNFLKELDEAEEYLIKAKKLREKNDLKGDLSKTLNNLGVIYENVDIDETLRYYQESLKINDKVGNIAMKDGLLNNIGRVYYHKAEFDKGIKKLKDSLDIRERIGDRYGISLSYVNLGLIYTYKGDFEKAIDYHQKSLEIAEDVGDNYVKSINLRGLGKTYLFKGELDKAFDYYNKSLKSSKEGNNRSQTSLNLSCISEIYLIKGENEKAKEEAEKALEISLEINTVRENAVAHRMIGRIYKEDGNYDKALDELEISRDKLKKSGFTLDLGETLIYLGKLYTEIDEEKSKKVINEAKNIFEKSNANTLLNILND